MLCPLLGEQYMIVNLFLPQLKKKYTFSPLVIVLTRSVVILFFLKMYCHVELRFWAFLNKIERQTYFCGVLRVHNFIFFTTLKS